MKKKKSGRQPLPKGFHRVRECARLANETYKYFHTQDVQLGWLLDQLVQEKISVIECEPDGSARETLETGLKSQASDTTLESPRSLLALIYQRGSAHSAKTRSQFWMTISRCSGITFLLPLKERQK